MSDDAVSSKCTAVKVIERPWYNQHGALVSTANANRQVVCSNLARNCSFFSFAFLFMNVQETLKSERWQKLGGTVVKGLVHGVHQEMALGSP